MGGKRGSVSGCRRRSAPVLVLFPLALASALQAAPRAAEPEFMANIVNEPGTLDPALAETDADFRVVSALFEGPVGWDPRTGGPVPALAESWAFSPDGLSLTFTLRDAKFSDGSPIGAADVKASWLRAMAPETAAPMGYLVAMAVKGGLEYSQGKAGPEGVGLDALSERVLRVRFPGPLPYALELIANMPFMVVPTRLIEREGSAWTRPGRMVSSGAFRLASWTTADSLVVERNELYHGASDVALKRITYRFIADSTTAWRLFRQGGLDWMPQIPLQEAEAVRLDPSFRLSPLPASQYIIVNNARKPLDDPRVRKALSLAIDREAFVKVVLAGIGSPARSLVPAMPGYEPLAGLGRGRDDAEAARAFLAEAGFPGGRGFPRLSLSTTAASNQRLIAEYLMGRWKEVLGIEVTHRAQEFRVLVDSRATGDFELSRGGWYPDYPDPNSFLELFITGASNNRSKFSDPRYDALLREASAMGSGSARTARLREAERILVEDQAALIPLYFERGINVIDLGKWKGWYANPLDIHPWTSIAPAR